MEIDIYQVDAFTDQLFGGNPAAICPLKDWISNDIMQKIAIENNLAETAFFVREDKNTFHLKWFTPECEMDLCGHATLASAFVIFNYLDYHEDIIHFNTLSGVLKVKKDDAYLEMDFPSRPPVQCELPEEIAAAFSIKPQEVWKNRDYLLIYNNEEEVKDCKPNTTILDTVNIDPGGIIITAKSSQKEVDFVSRFFTPQAVVFEDPVTGSAHCVLTPFWADSMGKSKLIARQISSRMGDLICELKGDRVFIKGKAVPYLKGKIYV